MCNLPKLLPPPNHLSYYLAGEDVVTFFTLGHFQISDFFRSKKMKLKNSVLLYTSIKNITIYSIFKVVIIAEYVSIF